MVSAVVGSSNFRDESYWIRDDHYHYMAETTPRE